jgi:hypothetical protein
MLIYLAAIAAVLYTRPAFMFHSDGRWKEFGLHAPEKSPFPFWAFCLVWAVLSFGLSRFLFGKEEGGSMIQATANAATLASAGSPLVTRYIPSLTETMEDAGIEPLMKRKKSKSASKKRAAANAIEEMYEEEEAPKPGYYKLNTNATKRNGVPRYVYVGPELPSESEAEETESETE